MRKQRYKTYEKVEIIDVADKGKGVAKIDDLVIFVNQVVPGDVVDIKVIKKKRNYKEAIPTLFHKYSDKRTQPKCEHFGLCGGCKWQNMPYETQLFFKQKQVADSLQRIGKVDTSNIKNILGSEKQFFYRNKLEFTFSNRRWFTEKEIKPKEERDANGLGFHIPNMFDRIVDIKKCWLQDEPSNSIRLSVKKFATENNYEFYDVRNHKGFLRNIIIRTSTTGEFMVILVVAQKNQEKIDKIMNHILSDFPQISSLFYVINTKKNDTIFDLETHLFHGKDHIFEKMGGLTFKISPKSFYQTNSEQGYELYKIAENFANLSGNETVYDLYTGTGTIANFVAQKAQQVIGIEYIPEAIADAKENSKLNNITNTKFFVGDMKDVFTDEFITKNGKPDIIILDPPRAGVHKNVIDAMKFAKAPKIVYVSCNPATQARDIELLSDIYSVSKIQPVDMFPHTHHIENVVLLEKK